MTGGEGAPLASMSARLAEQAISVGPRTKVERKGPRSRTKIGPFVPPPTKANPSQVESFVQEPESGRDPVPETIPSRFPDLLRPRGRAGGARYKCGLVWFRTDLRLHDHAALQAASKACRSVACVFCFDPREYETSQSSGCDRTGPYRARFLLQCVQDLRNAMRERGGDLIVRVGKPEDVLPRLAKEVGAKKVFAHAEATVEEMRNEHTVQEYLKGVGVKLEMYWSSTLYHVDDLPFKLQHMPSSYAAFREQVMEVRVRSPLPAPRCMPKFPKKVEAGEVPTLQQLGVREDTSVAYERGGVVGTHLRGGESEAIKRLQEFLRDVVACVENQETGKTMKGNNFSSKISPWLAMGCLSPRQMFESVHNISKSRTTVSTSSRQALDWVVFELLWRDFFRFITKKYGLERSHSSSTLACA